MLSNDNFIQLRSICKDAGFTCRGTAFFRVRGETVLQVMKYSNKEHPFHVEIVDVGLFSLYSELLPQWLTSFGCIPTYNYRYISIPRWELERAYWEAQIKTIAITEDVLTFHFHLDNIIDSTIPFLNQICSQKALIDGIDYLEYRSRKRKPAFPEDALRWTDMNKYAPYLYEQQYDKAERVIMSYLNTYGVSQADKQLTELDPRAEELRQLALLARRGNQDEIATYLEANYKNNQKLTHFCTKTSRRK